MSETNVKKQTLKLASLVLLSLAACGNPSTTNDYVVCCQLADGTFSSETSSDCKDTSGTVVGDEVCACTDEVCCKNADGTYSTLPANECATVSADPDLCLSTDVCCKIDGQFVTVASTDCPDSQLATDDLCAEDPEVCCKNDDGTYTTLPTSECATVSADPDLCLDTEVCCRIDGQFVTVLSSACPAGQLAPADMCMNEPDPDVCCANDDGTYSTLPASQCATVSTDPDLCLQEEICCKTDAGFVILPASQCPSVAQDPDLCLEEEVCCRIDGQFVTVLETACPAGQLAPAEMCVNDPEVCCKIPGGYATMPASQCPAGQVGADFCLEVCCKGETGVQVIPAGQCVAPQAPVAADACMLEVCCETLNGYATVPQSECPFAQVTNAQLCEEQVCCRDAAGNMSYVSSSQCPATSVLPDEACVTPDTECVKFRAVDMSALPYTTTSGETLQSVTSFFTTYPAAPVSWSASCLDQPAGQQRAFAAVGYDLTLNFAAPVSSFFVLRYHAQTGDDLIVPGASTAATFCGATSTDNITKVTLPTPSTTVTVQDISNDGGSGYSVMLAECIEWAVPAPRPVRP